ncbi:MAG TPA: ATP-binding protein [Ignavibacteria bacterium]|nr:ATP-binding protein [Ignavibacteria bacterium]
MEILKSRKIYPKLKQNLENRKILILTGSRQVGKTTLMKMLREELSSGAKSVFVDMDIVSNREFGESLAGFLDFLYLNGYEEKGNTFYCFVDEFQKVKSIGNVFKNLYDNYPNIKIIASGSSSLSIKNNIKESLAGRKFIFEIFPLDFEEFLIFKGGKDIKEIYENIHKLKQPEIKMPAKFERILDEFLTFGGYPEVVLADGTDNKKQILKSIFDLYLEKDIIGFSKIENFPAFKKLVEILAVQNGQETNYSSLSKEVGIHVKTLKNYISLLEETYLLKIIKPFYSNKKKEVVKSPKVYFLDNGVRNFFLKNYSSLEKRIDKGVIWESYVFQEIIKNTEELPINFWRTKQGQEVDFIIGGQKILPVEVKYKGTGKTRDFGNTLAFMRFYNIKKGIILSKNMNKKVTVGEYELTFTPAINFVKKL